MAENSKIEWTDHTFNPWLGCTKVGPGCDHCYAEARMDTRLHRVQWGPGQPRQRTKTWGDPVRWNKQHAAFHAQHGRRQRVFCASLADWLDNEARIAWLVDLLDLIRCTPNLNWLLLSKRIGTLRKRLAEAASWCASTSDSAAFYAWIAAWLGGTPPDNVWLGATVVDQAEADRDIQKLLAVPARVRFLSIEPMLGPISFEGLFATGRINDGSNALEALHWVICGGESGPGARPMHPDWARSLRDQCEAAGVPFLFKQWGEWCPRGPESLGYPYVDGVPRLRMTDAGENGQDLASRGSNDVWMNRAGKRAAGRLLDGREHNGFPEVQHA